MSENKEYVSQMLDQGSIHISEEVIASIVSMAIQDVEGVYGLNTNISSELGKIAKKNTGKSIRILISEEDDEADNE